MAKEEIIINSQFALFFDSPIIKPEELWLSFNSWMGNIFDQTPLILPVPNDPNLYDVPIVQIRSNSGVNSCNIARKRADFFIIGAGKQNFLDIRNDLLEKIEKFYIFFQNKTIIRRVGFVTRFFIEDINQDKTIADKLINIDFQGLHDSRTHEAYVRYISRDEIKIDDEIFEINNFTTIEKFFARIPTIGDDIKGILITRDFNTIPEKNYHNDLDGDVIKKFIEKSEEKFKLEEIKIILWPTVI